MKQSFRNTDGENHPRGGLQLLSGRRVRFYISRGCIQDTLHAAAKLDFLDELIRDETPEAYEVLRRMSEIPFVIGEEFASKWQFLPYIEPGRSCNVLFQTFVISDRLNSFRERTIQGTEDGEWTKVQHLRHAVF